MTRALRHQPRGLCSRYRRKLESQDTTRSAPSATSTPPTPYLARSTSTPISARRSWRPATSAASSTGTNGKLPALARRGRPRGDRRHPRSRGTLRGERPRPGAAPGRAGWATSRRPTAGSSISSAGYLPTADPRLPTTAGGGSRGDGARGGPATTRHGRLAGAAYRNRSRPSPTTANGRTAPAARAACIRRRGRAAGAALVAARRAAGGPRHALPGGSAAEEANSRQRHHRSCGTRLPGGWCRTMATPSPNRLAGSALCPPPSQRGRGPQSLRSAPSASDTAPPRFARPAARGGGGA